VLLGGEAWTGEQGCGCTAAPLLPVCRAQRARFCLKSRLLAVYLSNEPAQPSLPGSP
jgi:hypothetical protein